MSVTTEKNMFTKNNPVFVTSEARGTIVSKDEEESLSDKAKTGRDLRA